MNKHEKLEVAKWILERNLAWIAAAEVKVGVVITINTAMLGALGAAFSSISHDDRSTWACLFTIIAIVASGLAILCAGISIFPRTEGPNHSLIFFGPVSRMSGGDYIDKFSRSTIDDVIDDCSEQIHRNAQIAVIKYKGVRNSMAWSFLAIIPWVVSISSLLNS